MLAARSALAEEPAQARLRVERSEAAGDCPDAWALLLRVNRIAHRSAVVREGGNVVLRVGIDHGEAGYSASLTARGARTGERDLDDAGPTCEGLAEALAVSIALLLDEEPSVPAPPPRVAPAPAALPPVPTGPGHGAPLPSSVLDVLVFESAGVVGPSTFGVEGNADFRVTPRLTLGGGVFALIDDTRRFGPGALHMSLVAIRANACFTFRLADASIGGALCGFPALGSIIATGRGFDQDRTASQPWFALGAGAVADGPIIGPLGLVTRLDLVVPVLRPSFVVEDLGAAPPGASGTAFRTSPVGVSLGVGVRAQIP